MVRQRLVHLLVGESKFCRELLREFTQNLWASHGVNLAGARQFHATKRMPAPARGGEKNVRVEDDGDGHGSRLVQESIDQTLSPGFVQPVPVDTALAGTLA